MWSLSQQEGMLASAKGWVVATGLLADWLRHWLTGSLADWLAARWLLGECWLLAAG
jgi:hypothetical protein